MKNIVIACVDIGSPQNGNVGYSIFYDGKPVFPSKDCSPDVEKRADEFVLRLVQYIENNNKIALGFECPLFVPRRNDFKKLSKQREGENGRPWSAGAGGYALVVGLPMVDWFLRKLTEDCRKLIVATIDSDKFIEDECANLFLWEAFSIPNENAVVTDVNESYHDADARYAAKEFIKWLEDKSKVVTIKQVQGEECISLIGTSMLRNGLIDSTVVLGQHGFILEVPKVKVAKSLAA